MKTSLLHEMKSLTPWGRESFLKASLEVSLIIPARNSSHSLESTVKEAHGFLQERYGNSFEIILVPNAIPENENDRSLQVAQNLARQFLSVQVCPHDSPRGKGAAVRQGFLRSRGRWIFFTDADLPYDLRFYDPAAQHLKQGFDLVTGNRRIPSSEFHVPVSLLPLAYKRHRLGLAFNRCVRWLLPITTTDTQAGIKAMSRRLAIEAFSRQFCPGFLFDLEIFLTAQGQGFCQIHLPVTLHLTTEKSTVRILRECVLVGNWLTRITWRTLWKKYGTYRSRNQEILSRYRQASFFTRLFLTARWKLTPYRRMAAFLPPQGRILDLGCGHGLFALAAAANSPSRNILGIDHDSDRIQLGTQATADLPNIQFHRGSMTEPLTERSAYIGISMIDVMHYFDPLTQEVLLKKAHDCLEKGGTLLVREVNPQGGLPALWNRLYEKIATGIGFTRAEKKGLHFRSPEEWEQLLERTGFKVTSERCSSFLFADILYVCERLN